MAESFFVMGEIALLKKDYEKANELFYEGLNTNDIMCQFGINHLNSEVTNFDIELKHEILKASVIDDFDFIKSLAIGGNTDACYAMYLLTKDLTWIYKCKDENILINNEMIYNSTWNLDELYNGFDNFYYTDYELVTSIAQKIINFDKEKKIYRSKIYVNKLLIAFYEIYNKVNDYVELVLINDNSNKIAIEEHEKLRNLESIISDISKKKSIVILNKISKYKKKNINLTFLDKKNNEYLDYYKKLIFLNLNPLKLTKTEIDSINIFMSRSMASILKVIKSNSLIKYKILNTTPFLNVMNEMKINDTGFINLEKSIESNLPQFRLFLKNYKTTLNISNNILLFEAIDIVKKSLSQISSDIPSMIDEFIDKRYINFYDSNFKENLGITYRIDSLKQTRINIKFDKSYEALATIAHEFGHAFSDKVLFLNKSNSFLELGLEECISQLFESCVFLYLYENSFNLNEQKNHLGLFLSENIESILKNYQRTYFEERLLEKINPGLNFEDISDIYEDSLKHVYGDSIIYDSYSRYGWMSNQDLFESDFYYSKYLLGRMLSLILLFDYKACKENFGRKLINVIINTAGKNIDKGFSCINIDVNNSKIWDNTIKNIESYIEIFNRYKGGED